MYAIKFRVGYIEINQSINLACWVVILKQDGVHVEKNKDKVMTDEQKKIMRTQDIKYVEMKRVSEAKVRNFFLSVCLFMFVHLSDETSVDHVYSVVVNQSVIQWSYSVSHLFLTEN